MTELEELRKSTEESFGTLAELSIEDRTDLDNKYREVRNRHRSLHEVAW
jgi:hypothetical protein